MLIHCSDCDRPIANHITNWIGYPTVKTCEPCTLNVIRAPSVNERLKTLEAASEAKANENGKASGAGTRRTGHAADTDKSTGGGTTRHQRSSRKKG